jgi:uncharacterized repeat protein (TIGR01451 family)
MTKRRPLLIVLLIAAVLATAVLALGQLAPVTAAPAVVNSVAIIDDFESGIPAGWFQYGDGGTTIVPTTVPTDTVPGLPTNNVLSIEYTSAGWGGGTGHDLGGQDWSQHDGFAFWFYGSSSTGVYRVILSDNGNPAFPNDDTAERFAYEFVDNSTGWRYIAIPWGSFFRDYAYQPPNAPNDGLTLTAVEAYAFALPIGTRTAWVDEVRLFQTDNIDDFESGLPAGWFQYGDGGTIIVPTTVPTSTVPGLPTNNVLSIEYTSAGWGGGTGHDLGGQDWSQHDGFAFWFYGSSSATVYRVILSDNGNPAFPNDDTAERFAYEFVDNSTGWRYIAIPWGAFFRDYAYQPPNAPNDGLTLTAVEAYALALPIGTRTAWVDEVVIYGDGQLDTTVGFAPSSYSVVEGGAATITVTLNVTTTDTVMVDYETVDGTAVAGTDYTAISGTLTFTPGSDSQSFTVTTLDNAIDDGNRELTIELSNAVSATLNANSIATLTITDDETADPASAKTEIVDDFESGIPNGVDGDGLEIGFVTWGDFWTGTTVAITTTNVPDSDPLALPGQSGNNTLYKVDLNVNGWGGTTHAFENETVDTWTPQDWTSFEGITFWLYGNNTGNTLLFEIQDNRNPGSTTSDAEIWNYTFTDDFSGWRFFSLGWDEFTRKEIGNGAPNDGFGRDQVHAWAFGSLDTGDADVTYYMDNVALLVRTQVVDDFESGQIPNGLDGDGLQIGYVTWGDFWTGTTVGITVTTATDSDPLAKPGQTGDNILYQVDLNVNGWGGTTHAFENGAVDTWITQNWSTFEGVCFWLYGNNTGNTLLFEIQDNRNPGSTTADTEIWNYTFTDDFSGWRFFALGFDEFTRKEIGNGAPNDGFGRDQVHGWAFGSLDTGDADLSYYIDDVTVYGNTGTDQPLIAQFSQANFDVDEGDTAVLTVTLNHEYTSTVTVDYATAESIARPDRQFTPVSGTLTFAPGETEKTIEVPTHHDGKYTRDNTVAVVLYEGTAPLGFQRRAVLTINNLDAFDPALIDDFEGYHPFIYTDGNVDLSVTTLLDSDPLALPGQFPYEDVLTVDFDTQETAVAPASFERIFSQGQDWSSYDGLSFWYYGNNSGDTFTMQIRDNMTATTAMVDPDEWVLVWSDEFDDVAGTSPNPNVWKNEFGDGALNNIVGWGNSEFQYYTNDPANVAMDGSGNLMIRLLAEDVNTTDKVCWYGPCEYTSARLLTQDQLDFEYGRMEARVQVPTGPGGLWPAFWMLGTDIPEVGWPQSGEIDIMEYVSRLPNEVFGTIHGPGYSGGASIGDTYTFGVPVSTTYHTFAVEWTLNSIVWYVDDIEYHSAIPADVAPNEWVFNHPFFILLNMAIGGNFGGQISDDMTMPQDMLVDYVRVYQAADTAERFDATFVDDFTGWQKLFIPFDSFTRSAIQPVNAPNDGLGLDEVWGYGVILPDDASGIFHMDQVRLDYETAVLEIAKTVQPETDVAYQGTVTYTITLANVGNGLADTVTLTDTLPADVAFGAWVDQPAGATYAAGQVSWTGELAVEEEVVLVFTAVHTGSYGQTITNTAWFTSADDTGQASVAFTVEDEPVEEEYILFLPVLVKP